MKMFVFEEKKMKGCDCICLFREKMAQAYEFALEKVGMDVYSYTIWNDYIAFQKQV